MREKILLILQQEHSDPGRVVPLLNALGYETDIRRLALGDPLPSLEEGHAGAIVFGGPMSANDDTTIPFIRAELDWIPHWLASNRPYLGICLGAQLLARVLGGKVGPHQAGLHEIGYYRIEPTDAGKAIFGDELYVYHWHGEGIELPASTIHLAQNSTFPVQAFRYGAHAYGLQFHPEVTPAIFDRWTVKAAHRMVLPGAQCRERQVQGMARYDVALGDWLEIFLQRWLNPQRQVEIAAAD